MALALIMTLCPAPALLAQAAAVGQSVAGTPMSLHITILEGEDALNNIRERTAREPIVEVDDENHKPVAGALILFTIDGGPNGASGSFSGLTNTFSITTDAQGRAVAHGLLPNKTPGKYTITVSATVGTLVATAIIHQANIAGIASGTSSSSAAAAAQSGTAAGRTGSGFRILHIPTQYLVLAGALAGLTAVIVVTVTAGKSSTTITPGNGTVGP